MKKILSLVAVALLTLCLVLTVGCDKEDSDKGSSDLADITVSTTDELPTTSAGYETDEDGNKVYVEDSIDADDLFGTDEDTEEPSSSTETPTTSDDATSSATENNTSQDNTSGSVEDVLDTDGGYSQGWVA